MKVVVHKKICVGCRSCEMACAWAKEQALDPRVARIWVKKNEASGDEWPVVCIQCDTCVDVCPTAAISKDEEAGWITVDRDKCIACGTCVETCPIGAMRMGPEGDWAMVCDTCFGKSACVEICPTKAVTLEG